MSSGFVRHRCTGRRLGAGARLLSLALAAALMTACGNDAEPESDDYGNLLASPAGLVVVEEEHPTGWGRPDCLGCHEVRKMHVVNRTGVADLDMEAIREIVREEGNESCVDCHGTNGVEP
jgi:hypothetical protein